MRREIISLLESANPNAVVSSDLNLALLTMDRPSSQTVIEHYRACYESKIAQHVQPVTLTVTETEHEVRRILGIKGRATPNRSNILELCRRLANELSALDVLANLGN